MSLLLMEEMLEIKRAAKESITMPLLSTIIDFDK